jgi:hypothetical protein
MLNSIRRWDPKTSQGSAKCSRMGSLLHMARLRFRFGFRHSFCGSKYSCSRFYPSRFKRTNLCNTSPCGSTQIAPPNSQLTRRSIAMERRAFEPPQGHDRQESWFFFWLACMCFCVAQWRFIHSPCISISKLSPTTHYPPHPVLANNAIWAVHVFSGVHSSIHRD